MKKVILLSAVLIIGWVGFSFASAVWTRTQFTGEVDSFLASPRELSETNLMPLILNKARQFGIVIRPEDIQVRITSSDRETTTSRLMENKGLKAEVRMLTLHIEYGQSFLGTTRHYSLDRERTFTAQVTPSAQTPTEQTEPPAE